MNLDDPATTLARKRLLQNKRFLRLVYLDWYHHLLRAVPPDGGPVLELGSGPGFLPDVMPDVITSEVLPLPHVGVVLDARHLPIREGSLRGIVMTDVLHHIADVRSFLIEASHAVRPGGVIAMIEPWRTPWSEWVYRRLHHEPFDPHTPRWEFPSAGPLSSANGALPWILFERDRETFEKEFSSWNIEEIRLMMPLRYLLSGGFSAASLQPGFTHGFWRRVESLMESWNRSLAMFAFILLRRGYPRS